MEEILASIRRIISEDDSGSPVTAKPAEDDVLVLTEQMVQSAPNGEAGRGAGTPAAAVMASAAAPTEPTSPAMPSMQPALVRQIEPDGEEGLVSPQIAAASVAALSQIPQHARHQGPGMAVSGDSLSVEALVRLALEPMLKSWLDENLQTIVETMVRREIERLAKRAELG